MLVSQIHADSKEKRDLQEHTVCLQQENTLMWAGAEAAESALPRAARKQFQATAGKSIQQL